MRYLAVELLETESRMEAARGCGAVQRSCLVGIEFQFCRLERFRDLLHDDVHAVNATGH